MFVCLFVCKWQQFYMNHVAFINRFGLPFCAGLNIKLCPDLDLSSRPCHYWLIPITSSSDSISTSLSLSSESVSYSSTWLKSAVDARVGSQWNCGIAYEAQHGHIGNNRNASQRRQWAFVQLGQLERRPLQWYLIRFAF